MKKLSVFLSAILVVGCSNRDIPIYNKCEIPKIPTPNNYILSEPTDQYQKLNSEMNNDQVISILIHNNSIANEISYKYKLAVDYIKEVNRINNYYYDKQTK